MNPFADVAECRRALDNREISAEELTRTYLSRIETLNEQLGAFLRVDGDGALRDAREVDRARKNGEPLGPLAGIPVGLKDSLVTRDLETTAASRILEGWIPPYDATAVAKLKSAGAVVLGKLNMDEFAMGSSNEHSAYGPCRNPWNTERVPGGSSGGSAAAVAAGLCPLSLGSDTGGSIRQPAALCGITGLKPTYGRVSRYGLIAFASSLDQIGPMGRSAEDVAAALQVLAGRDPHDATSLDAEVPDYLAACRSEAGVRGMRIGRARELDDIEVDAAIRARVDGAIEALAAEGAEIVEVSLPYLRHSLAAYYLIAPAEASSNLARYDGVRYGKRAPSKSLQEMYSASRGEGFGTEVKRRIMLGTFALRAGYYDAYYKKAQQVRALIHRDFQNAFESVDAIASPTTPTTAFPIGAVADPLDMYREDVFTLACNLAGLPGISLPCGFDDDNLPIGLQLLAAPLQEPALLRIAAHFQRIDQSHLAYPELAQ
jgi:aspartyl-tRNA(Asn)/glutamyl-tRNA(Gln) amidotransferase subunit A